MKTPILAFVAAAVLSATALGVSFTLKDVVIGQAGATVLPRAGEFDTSHPVTKNDRTTVWISGGIGGSPSFERRIRFSNRLAVAGWQRE